MIDKKLRVFVVDDEPIIAMSLAAILSHHGYAAVQFTDPLKALEAAQRDAPDLLLSDVMMPGLTGVELAIQVKALCPACRVLLISGQAVTVDLLGSARLRGHHFELLTKPVAPPYLIATIQQTLQSLKRLELSEETAADKTDELDS